MDTDPEKDKRPSPEECYSPVLSPKGDESGSCDTEAGDKPIVTQPDRKTRGILQLRSSFTENIGQDLCLCEMMDIKQHTFTVPLFAESQAFQGVKGVRCPRCNLHKQINPLPAESEITTRRQKKCDKFCRRMEVCKRNCCEYVIKPSLLDPCFVIVACCFIFCWVPRTFL